MSFLKSLIKKETFFPSLIGLAINPFYHARRGLVKAIEENAHELQGNLLDVGCGSKPYAKLFNVEKYIGLDTDSSGHNHINENIDVYFDGEIFPFEDNTFQSVLCNQVLEHVFKPDLLISEIFRVLKPGGICLLTVPFLWDEHEQPFDYARYSSFGLKYLFEKNGFKVIRYQKINTDLSVLTQMLNAYLYKITKFSPLLRIITTLTFMFLFNILGFIVKVLPKNEDLYLDNLILVKKPSNG